MCAHRRRPHIKKPVLGDEEVYRDLMEQAGDLDEIPNEPDEVRGVDDQIRLYRKAGEESIREDYS